MGSRRNPSNDPSSLAEMDVYKSHDDHRHIKGVATNEPSHAF
ncbi:hypothetical protein BOH78_0793 [Pichia kudriavzevii]|uniref:Uncharacterized protein n=1 Tax=Pichia kudriavzevii TaxID=4909 RepID=A0A1V2LTB2_PICKU|nr:hypothetical protein BOH78_0793 [Pichia kudriavzevii]